MIAIAAAALSAAPGGAADDAAYLVPALPRFTEPMRIDGVLDERAWDVAARIDDFRQVEPVEGAPPSESTEVRLGYDDQNLYVAFICRDRDPDAIIATQLKRDGSLGADDRVSFVVDPAYDRRNGYRFQVNALGAKNDALVELGRGTREDWDGIWYAATQITDDGWTVEVALPLKTLAFDPRAERWGFNADRVIRRRNETVRWANPARNRPITTMANAGVLEGLTGLERGAGLDIKPYVVGNAVRNHAVGDDEIDFDAGVDAFYKITPALTLAFTINTDFAETEVDERRVNLTRFPLFFPEKRDFFLQDAGIFNFGGIRQSPLPFQSRRIGLVRGNTIPILAGIKLTGRVGGINLGLLDVETRGKGDIEQKNLFVGRASVNVLEQSTAGVIFTHGDPQDPGDNTLFGADFNYRTELAGGTRTLTADAWIQHTDSDADGSDESAGVRVSYPNDRVNWRLGIARIGERFDPALGFVQRRGIYEIFGGWRYRWRPENSWIRNIDSGVDWFIATNLDRDVQSRSLSFELIEVVTQRGDRASFEIEREREVLIEPFEISDGIVIPRGDYKFDRYGASLGTDSGRSVDAFLRWTGGEFYNGTRQDYGTGVNWRVSPNLFLGGELSLNSIDLPGGSFVTRIIRGRANIFFSPNLSWTTFAQYDNVSSSIGINSRVRWIVEPGNELFFVLNQDIDRDGSSLRVRRSELTTKVGWTFRF